MYPTLECAKFRLHNSELSVFLLVTKSITTEAQVHLFSCIGMEFGLSP